MQKTITKFSKPVYLKSKNRLKLLTTLLAFLGMSQMILSQNIFNFTNAGAAGATGPTQAQVNTAYASTNLNGSVTVTGGIQFFTVPYTGLYTIDVKGASGGGTFGGKGARTKGEFVLTAGTVLKILVGQQGIGLTSGRFDFSGGGGSFVTDNSNTPLIIAGGGGGAEQAGAGSDGQIIGTANNGTGGYSNGSGGTSGNGGTWLNQTTDGGAGLTGNGASGNPNPAPQSFVNGGQGGCNTWAGGCGASGGFGGGGASNRNDPTFHGAGGGGGYSGGGAAYGNSTSQPIAGGGASYNSGSNQINTVGFNTGNGAVSISVVSAEALNFDGSNDYVSVPHNTSLNFSTGDFTIESYFKSSVSQPNYAGIVCKANPSGNGGYQLAIVGNKLAAEFSGGGQFLGVANGLSGTTTITDGNWHHVAMVVTRSQNKIELLVDGNVEASVVNALVSTINVDFTTPMLIGVERTSSAYLNGNIDEVRLWNVARTKCQINTYKNCEIAATATGLVANYHFNQGFDAANNPTVTTLTDASGNSNNGALTNFALTGSTSNWISPGAVVSGSTTPLALPVITASPTNTTICNGQSALLTGGGGVTYTWTSGVVNATAFAPSATASYTLTGSASSGCTNSTVATVNVNNCNPAAALNFDGNNDIVDMGNSMNTVLDPLNKITVEAWVKPTNNTYLGVIVGNYATPAGQMQFLLRRDNSEFTFWVDDGTGFKVAGAGVNTSTIGVWQHVSGVWDGSKIMIYINGVLKGTTTGVTGASFATTANPVKIGGNNAGTPESFAGSVDEVRIWTVARTQCEINTFKGCEIPTTATGLLANYHFNQGFDGVTNTVTTLTNAASGLYNGTLSNFALTGSISNWIAPGGVISGSVTPASLIPVVTANPSNTTICSSQAAILTGGGASTYTWTGGITNATTFTPGATSGYTVTGTNTLTGCTNTAAATVNVNTGCTPAAALNFDGVNDYVGISATTNIPVGNSPYTIEAKIKPTALGIRGIVGWGNYGTANQVNALRIDGSGNIMNYWWGPDLTVSYAPINLLDGNWHHVAATFDGTTRRIFVDGVLKGSDTPGAHTVPNTNNLRIGSTCPVPCGGEFFAGGIDEVRIWNIGRTQCEINMYKDCEIPSTATGLAANYHFNQAFDGVNNPGETSLTDASGNANTGTLSNFALTGVTSNWIAPGGVISGSVTPASLTPVVTANATNPVICNGVSTTLNGGGASTYTWTSGVTNGVAFAPANTATYTVVGTNATNGCTNSAVAAVTVNPLPVISVNSGSICNGQSFTMIPSGASTYTFSNGSAIVNPAITSSYSVTGTDVNGCVSSAAAVSGVTVNALPVISVNSGVICNGQSFTMTPTGATTYTFSNGSAVVAPSITSNYSVTGTDAIGCVSAISAVSDVTVNALPVVTTSVTNPVICEGSTTTLNGGGADTYTWTGGVSDGVAFTPLTSGSYTVTGTNTLTGCSSTNTAVESVTVNLLPIVTAAITNSVICEGSSTTLNGGGADTYTWTGGVTDGVAFTPTVTGSYTVTGTNTLTGCTSTNVAVESVTVNPNPVISAASGAICVNGSYTITPAGANTYTISGGSAIVSPSVTTSYSVTGTSTDGCTGNTAVVTVSVQSSLTVSIAGSNSVCDGNAVSLTANGAATYSWNTGSTSNSIAPTPTVNTTYSVVGSSGSCSDSAIVNIVVNANPTVSAVSNTSLICSGQSVSLTASGATTYTWNTNATGANIMDTPTTTTTYTVTGEDVNGCTNTAMVTQNVSPCTGIYAANAVSSSISLYPNPTTGMVTIEVESNAAVIVLNTLGQVINAENMAAGIHQLDIKNQANGIYFVKVIQKDEQQTIKLIKE